MLIVIAEDSALLRAGFERILIDAGHEVMAGVADARNLLAVNESHPDLAIVDVRTPPTSTDEASVPRPCCAARIPSRRRWCCRTMSRSATPPTSSPRRSGFDYLLKDRIADVPAFLAVVMVVAGGGTPLDPEVVSQILARSHRRSDAR